MEIENACEPVQLIAVLVLVAVTVKLNTPVAVGVPLIAPPLESDRPVGKCTDRDGEGVRPRLRRGRAMTLWPV